MRSQYFFPAVLLSIIMLNLAPTSTAYAQGRERAKSITCAAAKNLTQKIDQSVEKVFFATNRKRANDGRFEATPGAIIYGWVDVNFAESHRESLFSGMEGGLQSEYPPPTIVSRPEFIRLIRDRVSRATAWEKALLVYSHCPVFFQ